MSENCQHSWVFVSLSKSFWVSPNPLPENCAYVQHCLKCGQSIIHNLGPKVSETLPTNCFNCPGTCVDNGICKNEAEAVDRFYQFLCNLPIK